MQLAGDAKGSTCMLSYLFHGRHSAAPPADEFTHDDMMASPVDAYTCAALPVPTYRVDACRGLRRSQQACLHAALVSHCLEGGIDAISDFTHTEFNNTQLEFITRYGLLVELYKMVSSHGCCFEAS